VAAELSAVSGVPGRYATALFDLAQEQKAAPAIAADLDQIASMLDQSEDFMRLVRSPVFSAEDQIGALDAVCEKAGIGGLTLNFLKLVASNRRLFALPGMISAFRALLAQSKGEVQAEVTSADKLAPKHVTALKAALKASMGREVQLSEKVDQSILGGLIVKVGSRMMDNSLKTKLQNLRLAMKGTA
jgi:F-type H+-transporting ATPase subunit delta